MVNYRRYKIKGGIYFFTQNLRDRKASYLTQHIKLLTQALRRTRNELPFETIAMVVLPDHLHVIWRLPENDDDFALRWRKIKKYFTESLIADGVRLLRDHRRNYNLWQKRYWEHFVRNEKDYELHVNYIHYNPVKHGLVQRVKDWPYSTFHRFVSKGILPEKWGDLQEYERGNSMGERI